MPAIVYRFGAETQDAILHVRQVTSEFVKQETAVKSTSVAVEQGTTKIVAAARARVEALVKEREATRAALKAYDELAAGAVRGSEQQVSASKLAAEAAMKLGVAYKAAGDEAVVAARRASEANALAAKRTAEESGLARGFTSRVSGAGMMFGGAAFIGGAIAGEAVKTAIAETARAQTSLALLQNALKATGQSWRDNAAAIQTYLNAQEKRSGFDQVELRTTLSQMVRATGSVKEAEKDLGLEEDLARARHQSLTSVVRALIMAEAGRAGSLARMGLIIQPVKKYEDELRDAHVHASTALKEQAKALDVAATRTEILRQIQEKFGGSSQAFMKTIAGRAADLHNTYRELEVEIGNALLPVMQRFVDWLQKQLSSLKDNHDLMRQLRDIADGLAGVLHDVWEVVRVLWAGFQTLSDKVGGAKNALEILLGIIAVNKIRSIASAILSQLVTAGIARIGPAAVAAAAETDAAFTTMGLAAEGASAMIKTALITTGIGALVVAVGIAVGLIISHWNTVKRWIEEFGKWLSDHAYVLLAVPIVGQMLFAATMVIKHWQSVKDWLTGLWKWLQESAYNVALAIVEPFSHLPGRFGHWARVIKDELHDKLWSLEGQAAATAANEAALQFGQTLQKGMAPWLSQIQGNINAVWASAMGPGATSKPVAPGTTVTAAGATTPQQRKIVEIAGAVSVPYSYGGGHSARPGPSFGKSGLGLDCSGFTRYVFAQMGIDIGGDTYAQFKTGEQVIGPLQVGDLVFFNTHPPSPGHVGIYIGKGNFIAEGHTGDPRPEVHSLTSGYYADHYVGARRVIPTTIAEAPSQKKQGKKADVSTAPAAVVVDTGAAAFNAALAAAPSAAHVPKTPDVTGVRGQILAEIKATRDLATVGFGTLGKELRARLEGLLDEAKKGISRDKLTELRQAARGIATEIRDGMAAGKLDESIHATVAGYGKAALSAMGEHGRALVAQLRGLEAELAKHPDSATIAAIGRRYATVKATIQRELAIGQLQQQIRTTAASMRDAFVLKKDDLPSETAVRATLATLRARLAELSTELRQHPSNADIAAIRRQYAQVAKTINTELGYAQQIMQAKQQAFETAWSRFSGLALSAFDRATSAHITIMQRAFSAQVDGLRRALEIEISGMQKTTDAALAQMQRDTKSLLDAIQRDLDTRLSQMKADLALREDEIQRALDLRTSALEARRSALTPSELALSTLMAAHDAAQAAQELADAQAALAAAKESGDPQQILAAQKQLDDLLYQQQVAALAARAQTERAALDASIAAQEQAAKDQADAQRKALEDAEAAQEQAYQDQATAQQQAIQDQADAAQQAYRDQADAAQQALRDQLDARIAAMQDEETAAEQNYQDLRDIQRQALQAQLDALEKHLEDRNYLWSRKDEELKQQVFGDAQAIGGAFYDGLVASFAAAMAAQPYAPFSLPGGGSGFGGVGGQAGGLVVGGQIGRDSVPILAMPGEYLASQQEVAAAVKARLSGSGDGGTTIVLQNPQFWGASELQVRRALAQITQPGQARIIKFETPIGGGGA